MIIWFVSANKYMGNVNKVIKRLVNRYKTNETFKYIFWITMVYVFAQGLLLIVSGIWWDDWGFVNKDWEYLRDFFLQSSIPLQSYIDASLWLLPDGAYRILVFFYFYIGSFLVYTIMKKIDVFSSEAVFWITLLYITIPINDARITWICYGYSLGLFSFWIAFWLVTLWQDKQGKKAVTLRILSLVILVFSYNTESIMLMTLIILLYLYYEKMRKEWKRDETRANVIICFKTVLCYMDFLLAPIVFYFGKHILFPGRKEYRYVDWQTLPELMLHSPVYAWETMMDLISNYRSALSKRTVLIVLAVTVLCYLLVLYMRWRKKSIKTKADVLYRNSAIMLLVGMFCFFCGLFPYEIYCKGELFEMTGTAGRHSLLLGIGTAMIFYYVADIVFRREIRKVMLVSLIVLGVCHFNLMYLDWQASYYQELRFQTEIAENQNILDNDTFLYLDYWQVFYVLNGISYKATGEETRLYLSIDRVSFLADNNEAVNAYNMRDWDYSPENRHFDGILLFNNAPISNSEVVKLKLKELFDKDAFSKWISETKDITFIPVTEEESNAIIKANQEGILNRRNVFDYVGAY